MRYTSAPSLIGGGGVALSSSLASPLGIVHCRFHIRSRLLVVSMLFGSRPNLRASAFSAKPPPIPPPEHPPRIFTNARIPYLGVTPRSRSLTLSSQGEPTHHRTYSYTHRGSNMNRGRSLMMHFPQPRPRVPATGLHIACSITLYFSFFSAQTRD